MRFIALLLPFLVATASATTVDLHQHLMMKDGMGFLMRGGFEDPIETSHWEQKVRSKANRDTLATSGLRIVVVSLYAHPWLTKSVKQAIEREIARLEEFLTTDPTWIIARGAGEARRALDEGKKVFVLSLETAAGILDTEADLENFIDRRGIRIVTFMHLSPDYLGGVALWGGQGFFAAPWDWIKSFFSNTRDAAGVLLNQTGLSVPGKSLLSSLVRRKVWIDLAHASDLTQEAMIPALEEAGQPLLYTHTTLRRFNPRERSISDAQLERVRKSGGLVGLVPSADMLGEGMTTPCPGGIGAYGAHVQAAAAVVGPESVMLGSDFNAPLRGLSPGCPGPLAGAGFYRASQIADLWTSLRTAGVNVPYDAAATERRFLELWARVSP